MKWKLQGMSREVEVAGRCHVKWKLQGMSREVEVAGDVT